MTTTIERRATHAPSGSAAPDAPARRFRALAFLFGVVATALAAWGLSEVVMADDLARPGVHTVRAVLVVAWVVAGFTLATRRPDEPFGALVLAGAAVGAAAAASSVSLADDAGSSGLEALRAVTVAALPAVGLHVLLALPTGELTVRTHRHAVITGYVVAAMAAGVMWVERPDIPLWVIGCEAALVIVVGASMSNTRYRAARGEERQRMQWFGLAVTVAAEIILVTMALRAFLGWPHTVREVAAAATIASPLALVACTSKRLIRHVDRFLAHTVSLTGLTGVVVAVYLVIVLGLGRVPDDDERTILLLSMVAAALAALLYIPTRDRLTGFSNRVVYGEQHAPDEALRTFGSRLSRAIPLDELLLQLVESLRKSMVLTAAEIWTGQGGILDRSVSVPDRGDGRITVGASELQVVARAGVSGPAWLGVWLPAMLDGRTGRSVRVAPITHSGELLGVIVVERHGDTDFSDEEELVLGELARQVGLALHNVQLDSALQESLEEVRRQAEELRASRTRVVAAADAARRKLERDLHDGAQQHLVALAVSVRLTRQIVDSDVDAAKGMLDEMGEALQEAVQELRNLAHGIYPPVLIDRGLPPALEAAAGRAALPTLVEAAGVGRFDQQVEAAIYFCCLEAMQNAGKHAGEGSTIIVTVIQDAEGLAFSVADDGVGFDAGGVAGKGHGFVNMDDRIGAVGGRLTVESTPGEGTRVGGRIRAAPIVPA